MPGFYGYGQYKIKWAWINLNMDLGKPKPSPTAGLLKHLLIMTERVFLKKYDWKEKTTPVIHEQLFLQYTST